MVGTVLDSITEAEVCKMQRRNFLKGFFTAAAVVVPATISGAIDFDEPLLTLGSGKEIIEISGLEIGDTVTVYDVTGVFWAGRGEEIFTIRIGFDGRIQYPDALGKFRNGAIMVKVKTAEGYSTKVTGSLPFNFSMKFRK